MLYQLPSGKVLYLSTEEYLSLNDKELHEIAHGGYGEDPSYSSYYVKGGKVEKEIQIENEIEDTDYNSEDESFNDIKINLNNLPE